MFHLRLTSTMPAGHLTTSAPGCPRFAAPDWSLVWVLFLSPQSAVPQQDASPDPRAPRNSAVSTEVTQKRIANPIFFNKRVKMKFLHLATNGNLSPVVTCVAPWIVAAPQAWPGPLRRCFVQRPGCRDFPCWTCAGMIHAPQHSWRHGRTGGSRRFPRKMPRRPRISETQDDCSVSLSGETQKWMSDVFDSQSCCDWLGGSCTAKKFIVHGKRWAA